MKYVIILNIDSINGTFAAFGSPMLGTTVIRRIRYFPEMHRAFCDPSNNYNLTRDSIEPFFAFVFLYEYIN
jgi:hypothetical protein